jgi:hypothetical protein
MRIWTHSSKDKGSWRGWLHLVNKNEHDLFDTAFTVSWGRAYRFAGFNLHIGNKGSETPIDWHIGFWWFAFYGSFSADWLRTFAQWIGRGHKRDIMLEIQGMNGAPDLIWKLWWDDDGGYDRTIHDCDKWRRPMLPPWRWGRKKYRSWMCLRNGRLELNPFDAIWGHRYFSYNTVEEDILLIEINQFPGDEYMVEFELQEVWRQRRHGPKLWVARRTFEGYTASWDAPGAGIPVRNHSWKGNGVLASSVKVQSRDTWRMDADIALVESIKKDREKYGYHPPVGRVLSAEMMPDGLHITGEIWNDITKQAISHNSLKHLSLGFDQTDKGIAMAAASMMEDGEIDMKTSYLDFEMEGKFEYPMPETIKLAGVIPNFEPTDGNTVFSEEAKQQLLDGLANKPITMGDQMKLEAISLDAEPNAFGETVHIVDAATDESDDDAKA